MSRRARRFNPGLWMLIGLIVAGIWLLQRPASPAPENMAAEQVRQAALGLDGGRALFYDAGESPQDEGELLLQMGDYWATRASYPTGRFEQAWIAAAARQARRVPAGRPAGPVWYRPESSQSGLKLNALAFTALGPRPLQMDGCQICFAYGRAAGRVNVIVSDPVSPTIAYLGSDGGGVWRTTNCCGGATSWTPVTDDPLLTTIAIGDMVIDPGDHNTVYAGTGDLRYGSWSFGSAGLLKTTDGGATWALLGSDVFNPVYPSPPGTFPQYQAIGQVEVDPRDSNRVIVGTKTGVFFSYNAGADWTGPCLSNSFTSQRQDVTGMEVVDRGSRTTLIVAIGTRGHNTTVQPDLDQNGANGVYTTTIPTGGCPASWNLVTRPDNGWPAGTGGGAPYPANSLGRIDLALAPGDPNIIYAQVAAIPTRGLLGVWRSLDGGLSWEQRSSVAGLTGCFGDFPQNWYDQGLAVDPNDPDVVMMSSVDLFRSTNGGATFVNLTCGYAGGTDVHVDHHARAYVGGSSSNLLVGTDGGVYVSHNADTADPDDVAFVNLNATLSTIEFYSGDITANFATAANPGINAGAQDNGSSVHIWSGAPGPAEWQMTTGADGMYARIEPIYERRWYQESQNGNLKVSTTGPFGTYRSATGGWTSERRSFIMPYDLYKYSCVGADGCERLIVGTYRVWETIEGGVPASSWYVNSPDLTRGTLGDRSFIQELAYAIGDSRVALAGTLDGKVWYGFGLGQGVTNSASWVDVTGGNAVLPNRPVMDMVTHPVTPTLGYAALGGFDENTPGQPGHVYQVTCDAACNTFTWVNKSGNLPNVPINAIAVNPRIPTQVFAGSDWGLYFTDDISVPLPVWQHFSAGLPRAMIWDMAVDRGFTTLAVFTRSRGAYAWPLPGPAVGPLEKMVYLPLITEP